jgi:nitrate/nitrite transport system substrate-binding protein
MQKRDGVMSKTGGLSRRSLIKGSASALATAAAARALFPSGAFAQASGPETGKAIFGYIALTDASPLIIAKEKGFFAKYGMKDVDVQKQASWGTTRDNIELGGAAGGIDGAHILTPMPYLISTGKVTKNNIKLPMYILARLNTNGQSISVAGTYKGMGVTTNAKMLADAFRKAKAGGKDIKCAMTFPGGTHDMWIRYWLAASGIDPDKDVSTITVPPPQMVANMKVNTMEAFCVGEPWNSQLVHQNIGFTALVTGELWKDHPEKSLGMRADWVDRNPKAAQAITAAVQEAAMWSDKMENKEELCKIVGGRDWFKVPVEDILDRQTGRIDFGDGRKESVGLDSPLVMKFWRDHANYPFKSHDLWFLTENIRWGYQPADLDTKALVDQVNREDIWRAAAKVTSAEAPASASRGKETFFDGKVFDPADPGAYLKSLPISRIA